MSNTNPHPGSIAVVAAARNFVKTGNVNARQRVEKLIGKKQAKALFKKMGNNPNRRNR
jgi:hypothetical protein